MNDKRFDRIEEKLDLISERLNNMDKTLAAQHVSLTEHIRRTELLESQVLPIAKHVTMVSGVFKFLGIISLLLGMAVAILNIISKLSEIQ